MRLFVASWPPADVVALLEALPRPAHPSVRWTTRDQWHVTLRFLGEVPEPEVDALARCLAGVAAHHGPRAVRVGPATRRLGRASLVLPVEGLDDLAAAVRDATAAVGRPPEGRPFTGHLTVARGRGRRPVPASLAGERLAGGWQVDRFSLVRSTLRPEGARYDDVAAFPLG